jgi:hypothetical protein
VIQTLHRFIDVRTTDAEYFRKELLSLGTELMLPIKYVGIQAVPMSINLDSISNEYRTLITKT